VISTVEDAKVEDQHHQNEKVKQNPESELIQASLEAGLEIKIWKRAKMK